MPKNSNYLTLDCFRQKFLNQLKHSDFIENDFQKLLVDKNFQEYSEKLFHALERRNLLVCEMTALLSNFCIKKTNKFLDLSQLLTELLEYNDPWLNNIFENYLCNMLYDVNNCYSLLKLLKGLMQPALTISESLKNNLFFRAFYSEDNTFNAILDMLSLYELDTLSCHELINETFLRDILKLKYDNDYIEYINEQLIFLGFPGGLTLSNVRKLKNNPNFHTKLNNPSSKSAKCLFDNISIYEAKKMVFFALKLKNDGDEKHLNISGGKMLFSELKRLEDYGRKNHSDIFDDKRCDDIEVQYETLLPKLHKANFLTKNIVDVLICMHFFYKKDFNERIFIFERLIRNNELWSMDFLNKNAKNIFKGSKIENFNYIVIILDVLSIDSLKNEENLKQSILASACFLPENSICYIDPKDLSAGLKALSNNGLITKSLLEDFFKLTNKKYLCDTFALLDANHLLTGARARDLIQSVKSDNIKLCLLLITLEKTLNNICMNENSSSISMEEATENDLDKADILGGISDLSPRIATFDNDMLENEISLEEDISELAVNTYKNRLKKDYFKSILNEYWDMIIILNDKQMLTLLKELEQSNDLANLKNYEAISGFFRGMALALTLSTQQCEALQRRKSAKGFWFEKAALNGNPTHDELATSREKKRHYEEDAEESQALLQQFSNFQINTKPVVSSQNPVVSSQNPVASSQNPIHPNKRVRFFSES